MESDSKFVNISRKLWQKSEIFYGVKLGPGGYQFMKKTIDQKSQATVEEKNLQIM